MGFTVLLKEFYVLGASQMAEHFCTEPDLPEFPAGIYISREKNIRVRFNENSYWQLPDSEEHLRGSLVLPVKDSHCSCPILFWLPPSKSDMQLRASFNEFIN